MHAEELFLLHEIHLVQRLPKQGGNGVVQIGQVQRAFFGRREIVADRGHEIRRGDRFRTEQRAQPREVKLRRLIADHVGQHAGARDDGDGPDACADARVVTH
ncbi:Uncharacterised protein [Mycobacterium tuberculosis]|uniref:Uncharacterized protein n=1 Tax=Mycobacterium tuberculosis TaxID=1773 RepID=A0A654TTH9_MYCTX|nr:Uncharacterised protein [Mycobacterium tuberculosis]CKS69604.1 Uncharacterised protein [Mycobacterium tuberculosis]CKT53050.1 Uncharacterised protein [Mycobacterium tuberculosis]COV30873.1 Uncharacterised protein [Mycobacterium tuberculosis]COX74699.1 Uncharacterised protein [Mycobacterium tuberculosis]